MEGKNRNGKRGFTEDNEGNEGGEGDGNLTTKSTKTHEKSTDSRFGLNHLSGESSRASNFFIFSEFGVLSWFPSLNLG
jgi:hypothetical protein